MARTDIEDDMLIQMPNAKSEELVVVLANAGFRKAMKQCQRRQNHETQKLARFHTSATRIISRMTN